MTRARLICGWLWLEIQIFAGAIILPLRMLGMSPLQRDLVVSATKVLLESRPRLRRTMLACIHEPPRLWLALKLIGLAGWIAGDLADRALKERCSKTAAHPPQ
jgi:hypothetical protein